MYEIAIEVRSDTCIFVRGDTQPFKDRMLKNRGFFWNPKHRYWIWGKHPNTPGGHAVARDLLKDLAMAPEKVCLSYSEPSAQAPNSPSSLTIEEKKRIRASHDAALLRRANKMKQPKLLNLALADAHQSNLKDLEPPAHFP
jgi:pyruvate-formate lyase-activating enzyme